MYSLRLTCEQGDAEIIAAELWEMGTVAISEIESGERVTLLAGFETEELSEKLLSRFAALEPEWEQDDTDWQAETERAWPPREIGTRLFLALPWSREVTPAGRVRVIHNPGLASGTGEHPCTQMALEALERLAIAGRSVVDVGTGSGILAIAARRLGAVESVALDLHEESLLTARENFELNALTPSLVCGSADCIADAQAHVTVANISGTVLLSILDELIRVTKVDGTLVITGFSDGEAETFCKIFPQAQVAAREEWRCLTIALSSHVWSGLS